MLTQDYSAGACSRRKISMVAEHLGPRLWVWTAGAGTGSWLLDSRSDTSTLLGGLSSGAQAFSLSFCGLGVGA